MYLVFRVVAAEWHEEVHSRLLISLIERGVVVLFAVVSLGSLWMCAGMINHGIQRIELLERGLSVRLGALIAIAATIAWLLLLPALVACVRDEFRFVVKILARTAAGDRP